MNAESYKGGTMSLVGFLFTNTGGVLQGTYSFEDKFIPEAPTAGAGSTIPATAPSSHLPLSRGYRRWIRSRSVHWPALPYPAAYPCLRQEPVGPAIPPWRWLRGFPSPERRGARGACRLAPSGIPGGLRCGLRGCRKR